MNPKHISMYMEIARVVAKTSYATRLKVGAVAVKDNRVLSLGYNGTPPGMDNECEHMVDGVLVTKPTVIHAEANCILKMARDGQAAQDADMFVTVSPCLECSKMILTAGFRKLWFGEQYRTMDGVYFLRSNGVEVAQV